MSSSFEIMQMTREDIPAVALVERACFAHPWSENALSESLSAGRAVFLTAKEAGRVIGYLGMEHVLDEGSITNVAVLPEYRRQGAAQALLTALLREAKHLSLASVTLEVRAGNEAAIRLYQGLHFLPVGRRKNFYTSPTEDAILMTVTFADETSD